MLYENEKGRKSNFVRLIGIHDTLYLVLMFALVILIISVIDAFAHDWLHLVNCLYLPFFAIYTANRVMDDKLEKLAKNNCFSFQILLSTIFFIGLYLFV
jgi:4-hydroxybenzoate polyprenyltransferase